MKRVDAHIHFPGDTAESIALLDHLDLKLLNICFAQDSNGQWREQAETYRALADSYPHRYAWCTSFDLPRFDDPNYVKSAIEGLRRDFAAGAVACKVWKNFGMQVRKPSGDPLLVDDPLLEPIFDFVADCDKTLLMHIADPKSCWEPMRDSCPHSGYYRAHPEWYMYGRGDAPSHETLIKSRDAVVARHPNLRIVGAHLASLEHDLAEVARRLDQFPNLAVDTSARLGDLARHNTGTVREFCIRYQDRILFGTDQGFEGRFSAMTKEERCRELREATDRFREHFDFFASGEELSVGGYHTQGVALPPDVADRILCENARAWYPGI